MPDRVEYISMEELAVKSKIQRIDMEEETIQARVRKRNKSGYTGEPRAVAGKMYTIKKGDTLSGISNQAYGIPRLWRRIYQANQKVLRSGNPNLIFPGEIIWIPGDAEQEKLKAELSPVFEDKLPDDMTFRIGNYELIGVSSASITRTFDTPLDGWRLDTAFNPDDEDQRKAFWPYSYLDSMVGIGQRKVMKSLVYGTEPSLSRGGRAITLTGYTKAVDMIDSVKAEGPYQANSVTLEQWAKDLAEPFGVGVVFATDPPEKPLKRVKIEPTERIGDHIQGLAKQHSMVVSCTLDGDLLFQRAEYSDPVAELREGQPGFIEIPQVVFDGRGRFRSYKAFGRNPRNRKSVAVAKDEAVRRPRFSITQADETGMDNIKKAAEWACSEQIAEALSINLTVPGWYTEDGLLWEPGQIVNIVSPTLFLFSPFPFLIREVSYKLETSMISTDLSLVLVETYTGERVQDPWSI